MMRDRFIAKQTARVERVAVTNAPLIGAVVTAETRADTA
jgi:hypothetical protein